LLSDQQVERHHYFKSRNRVFAATSSISGLTVFKFNTYPLLANRWQRPSPAVQSVAKAEFVQFSELKQSIRSFLLYVALDLPLLNRQRVTWRAVTRSVRFHAQA